MLDGETTYFSQGNNTGGYESVVGTGTGVTRTISRCDPAPIRILRKSVHLRPSSGG